jgi:anti-sigma factor ChrR (cupin superfamily)
VSAATINGDLGRRVAMDTAAMAWQSSPSGTVWRKRLHLMGSAESGQVTSLVRYQPHSDFPSHQHPHGEEILVLNGVFSDEHGDYPAGSYLLNPEGFRHAPFSREGCLLFVKLRQYPGDDRPHLAVSTRTMAWQAQGDGSDIKPLFSDARFPEQMRLERWPAGERPPTRYPGGVEMLVLEGVFEDESGSYHRHTWLRLPAGATHLPRSPGGCEVYIKSGGLGSLWSGETVPAEATQ